MIRRLRDLTSYLALAYRAASLEIRAARYRRQRDAAREHALRVDRAELGHQYTANGLLLARLAEAHKRERRERARADRLDAHVARLQRRDERCEREHGRLRIVTDPPGGDAA